MREVDIVQSFGEVMDKFIASISEGWSIKIWVSCAMTYLAAFFGDDWWLICALFWLLATDFACGVASAIKYDRALSGRRLNDGLLKFFAYGATIILAWTVQQICLHVVPIEIPVLAFYAGYQCLTEVSSISRHLKRLGVPLPKLFDRITAGAVSGMDKKLDAAMAKISQ